MMIAINGMSNGHELVLRALTASVDIVEGGHLHEQVRFLPVEQAARVLEDATGVPFRDHGFSQKSVVTKWNYSPSLFAHGPVRFSFVSTVQPLCQTHVWISDAETATEFVYDLCTSGLWEFAGYDSRKEFGND